MFLDAFTFQYCVILSCVVSLAKFVRQPCCFPRPCDDLYDSTLPYVCLGELVIRDEMQVT